MTQDTAVFAWEVDQSILSKIFIQMGARCKPLSGVEVSMQ